MHAVQSLRSRRMEDHSCCCQRSRDKAPTVGAGYQYDSTTGLYHDANTGFFYDSNAQVTLVEAHPAAVGVSSDLSHALHVASHPIMPPLVAKA